VLVNNAGIVRFGPITETDPAAWRQVIDINLTGTYLGIRAIVPSMRKAGGGAIVGATTSVSTPSTPAPSARR
jgi:3alpha(or 20beta)-hydroxysteroid dehydrogenase